MLPRRRGAEAATRHDKPCVVSSQALWGDYAYQPKTKRIVRIKGRTDAKPLFVQLALEPLWKAYTAVDPGSDSKVRGLAAGCYSCCPVNC